MWSITEISRMLGADSAGHRALRKAATSGTLSFFDSPAERIDNRGTQVFGVPGACRAAIILALGEALRFYGDAAHATLEAAEAVGVWRTRPHALSLDEAIALAQAGERVEFRRVIPGPGGNHIVHADTPLPRDANSFTTITLTALWRPIFEAAR